MNIGRIQINTQKLTFDITTSKAQLNLHQARPQMHVNRQELSKVHVTVHEIPRFHVNFRKVRAESGLPPPEVVAENWASESVQKWLENIEFIGQQGEILMDFKNGDGVARAAMNEMPLDIAEVNLGLMPQSSPEITWDEGALALDWSEGDLDISWTEGSVEANVTPHSVEIKIRDFPEVRISYQGNVSSGPGQSIDHKI